MGENRDLGGFLGGKMKKMGGNWYKNGQKMDGNGWKLTVLGENRLKMGLLVGKWRNWTEIDIKMVEKFVLVFPLGNPRELAVPLYKYYYKAYQ